MLLCDVLPGRRFVVETNRQHLQGPPTGYDSVYGNVGEDLNYPELVVYKPEAVLPRYIIIYRWRHSPPLDVGAKRDPTERVAQSKSGFYLWDFDFGGGAVGFKVEARQLQEEGVVGGCPPSHAKCKS